MDLEESNSSRKKVEFDPQRVEAESRRVEAGPRRFNVESWSAESGFQTLKADALGLVDGAAWSARLKRPAVSASRW